MEGIAAWAVRDKRSADRVPALVYAQLPLMKMFVASVTWRPPAPAGNPAIEGSRAVQASEATPSPPAHRLSSSSILFRARMTPLGDCTKGRTAHLLVVAAGLVARVVERQRGVVLRAAPMLANTELKRPEEASRVVECGSEATSEQAAVGMALVGLDGRFLLNIHNLPGANTT